MNPIFVYYMSILFSFNLAVNSENQNPYTQALDTEDTHPPTPTEHSPLTCLDYATVSVSVMSLFLQTLVRNFLKTLLTLQWKTDSMSPKVSEPLTSKSSPCCFHQSWTVGS